MVFINIFYKKELFDMKNFATLITLFFMSSLSYCSEKEPVKKNQYDPILQVISKVDHTSFDMQGVQEISDKTTIEIEDDEKIDYANDRLLATIEKNKNKKEKID